MHITRELFEQQRRPRFGNANPERMQLEFWEWMIRGSEPPPQNQGLLASFGMGLREGILKSGYGPWQVRDLFQIPMNRDEGPVWTFDRMGSTRTELPDGRLVCVAGEHEDSYDPDFCIYNDVIVLGPEDQIDIYGYPKDVFPPTDFHSATQVNDRILLIGCIGYPEDRCPGFTPVFELDLSTYQISPLETSGHSPGWIHRHDAALEADGMLVVRGGKVIDQVDRKAPLRRNFEEYSLDLSTGIWQQLTHRNWSQFRISREDRKEMSQREGVMIDQVLPYRIPYECLPKKSDCLWPPQRRIEVRGIPIQIEGNFDHIDVVVEGSLPAKLIQTLIEEIRANTEALCGQRCIQIQVAGLSCK